jgi:hypothetical protein
MLKNACGDYMYKWGEIGGQTGRIYTLSTALGLSCVTQPNKSLTLRSGFAHNTVWFAQPLDVVSNLINKTLYPVSTKPITNTN